jgi:hypothetical protein
MRTFRIANRQLRIIQRDHLRLFRNSPFALRNLAVLIVLALVGCSYSFKGGTVPAHLKSVAIPVVEDVSGYGDPSLREQFTRQLTQRFITDATLELADRSTADAVLEGSIIEVRDAPNVLQGGENVAQRRITVRVKIAFNDLKLRKTVWDKEFSNWGDYPSGGGLTQRQAGIEEAVRKLTEDILNDTVAGW